MVRTLHAMVSVHNSENAQVKFVRLNEGKNSSVLTNFAWASEVGW